MGILMEKLVNLSSGINLKSVSIAMTYLYLITVVIMVNSYIQLTKDTVMKKISMSAYKTRSLAEYYREMDHLAFQHNLIFDTEDVETFSTGIVANKRYNPQKVAMATKKGNKVLKIEKRADHGKVHVQQNVQKNVGQNGKKIPGKPKDETKQPVKYTKKYQEVEIVQNYDFRNKIPVEEKGWQNITADGTFLIFSAIMDHVRGRPNIRALGMNGNTYLPKFYCELTYPDSGILTVKGRIWMLPDHHEKQYKTVFLYCPLPDDRAPTILSIIPIKTPIRLHRLPVINNQQELRNFTVCLSPLFFNTSIEYDLVQWFELNRLVGADMFYVYNYSTVGRTDEILSHYQREGWVKVIQWQLPNYTDIHYYGQIAMMNDCFLRNYRISRYMVNIDIDEFIIPRKGKSTWHQLMPALPVNACEYSIRSTLLPTESKEVYAGKQKARELHLRVLLYKTRREYIFGKNVRTKYIVKTTCIDTVGIHYCWKYRNGTADTQRYHVAPRDALTYHFRAEPIAKEGKEIKEEAIYKYHTELIENAKKRWEKIESERKANKANNQNTNVKTNVKVKQK